MWILVVCMLLAAISAPFVRWYYTLYKFRRLNTLPGPRSIPLIGYPFQLNPKGMLEDVSELFEKYKQRFVVYIGSEATVFHSNPEHLQFMLTSKYLNKPANYDSFKPFVGEGLVTSKVDKWRNRRRLITPSFHFTILEQFMKTYNRIGDKLMTVLAKDLGRPVDVHELLNSYTFDVICETSMGMAMNSLENQDIRYVQAVRGVMEICCGKFFSSWQRSDLLFKMFSRLYKQQQVFLDYLHSFSKGVIEERRKYLIGRKEELQLGTEEDFGIKRKVTLIDSMLFGEDEYKLDIDDIREQVDTFMFAGHDTVSAATSYTMYLLAQHADVQLKLYEEILSTAGRSSEEITIPYLQDLQYLDTVVKESLRMYTPAPLIERLVEEEFELDGVIYPVGTVFAMGLHWMHHDPGLYPDPEKFDPDRFLPENQDKRHSFSYLPFSAGSRNCIGQRYALLLIKTTIVKIVQEYELLPVPGFELELGWIAVMKPMTGCYMKLRKREEIS